MGCGCSAGAVRATPQVVSNTVQQKNQIPIGECQYTMDQLQVWLTKLICCKDSGLYVKLNIPPSLMNKYLGIVMSALNYPTNPCYFQSDLGPIGDLIMLIANSGKC